jgi:hypothetical protein
MSRRCTVLSGYQLARSAARYRNRISTLTIAPFSPADRQVVRHRQARLDPRIHYTIRLPRVRIVASSASLMDTNLNQWIEITDNGKVAAPTHPLRLGVPILAPRRPRCEATDSLDSICTETAVAPSLHMATIGCRRPDHPPTCVQPPWAVEVHDTRDLGFRVAQSHNHHIPAAHSPSSTHHPLVPSALLAQ